VAVEPSAQIGYQLVPAPHSSVAVRNRQRRTAHGCQGHRGINGRGPRLRSATQRAWEAVRLCRERPLRSGARRYGSHQRRPTNDGAKLSLRRRVRAERERVRPIARARPGAPAGDEFPMEIIAAWRITPTYSSNHPGGPSWASFAILVHAPQGPRSASAGRQHDRQSNELSPGYWTFRRRRRKLEPDGRSQYLRRQQGNEPGMDNVCLRRYRVN
jgi:hypothetical protein